MSMSRDVTHNWHVAINRFHDGKRGADWDRSRFMYEAKTASTEVHRLTLLFGMEREGRLAKVHKQCSQSEPEQVIENYLTCCRGVRCSECPELQALDAADVTDADRDAMKAWTCVTHIIATGGDIAAEGYILTVDDRMFWERTYASLAGGDPDGEAER